MYTRGSVITEQVSQQDAMSVETFSSAASL